MNNIVPERCPVLIIEQQPCLYVLLRPLLEQVGFGPVYHAGSYTTMIKRWAVFFGAIVLLDMPLQDNSALAFADSSRQRVQEATSSNIVPAPGALLLLLGHDDQFAALPDAQLSTNRYLFKPFGPDELLLRLRAITCQQPIRVRSEPQLGSSNSTVYVRKRSVRCFTLDDSGILGEVYGSLL